MELKPPFLFHANAAAIGGRIADPRTADRHERRPARCPPPAAVRLSQSRQGTHRRPGPVRHPRRRSPKGCSTIWRSGSRRCAATRRGRADGDDEGQRRSAQPRREREGHVHRQAINGGFVAKSPKGSGEPSIALDRDTVVRRHRPRRLQAHRRAERAAVPALRHAVEAAHGGRQAEVRQGTRRRLFMKAAVPGPRQRRPAGRFVRIGRTDLRHHRQDRSLGRQAVSRRGDRRQRHHDPRLRRHLLRRDLHQRLPRRLTMLRMDLCCPQPMRLMMADDAKTTARGRV